MSKNKKVIKGVEKEVKAKKKKNTYKIAVITLSILVIVSMVLPYGISFITTK